MVGRLNFSVPEFVRTIWTSEAAREVWEPRISAVSLMYQDLEVRAVQTGFKPAALQTCSPDQLTERTSRLLNTGLVVVPLSQEGAKNHYASSTTPFDPARPWTYRIGIARSEIISALVQVWNQRDDRRIGELLGFPTCCQAFFYHYWVNEGFRDTTYPMVLAAMEETKHYEVTGPLSCNILLRWLGVRRVSHLPCRFDCDATRVIGDGMQKLAETLYPQEAAWLAEMLDWPIRWSSLHGVAIITTPVVRIVTSTDPLTDNVIIDRHGESYPPEGASGVDFPFQMSYPIKLTKRDALLWKDNGFITRNAMDDAHEVVIRALEKAEIHSIQTTLDLGCGNGLLLEKIGQTFNTALHGIESDTARWERAMQRTAGSSINIMHGDFFKTMDWSGAYDLIIVSLNRFLELDQDVRPIFIKHLAATTDYLLVYSYDGKEMDFSWPKHFDFVTGERSKDNMTIAYLLRSLKT